MIGFWFQFWSCLLFIVGITGLKVIVYSWIPRIECSDNFYSSLHHIYNPNILIYDRRLNSATRILTARLCASNPSTPANCSTVPDSPYNPSAVRFELVMCLRNEPRFTPEYCLA